MGWGRWVGGGIGAGIGAIFGQPAAGFLIGSTAGSRYDQPRQSELNRFVLAKAQEIGVSNASFGDFRPLGFGTQRMKGKILHTGIITRATVATGEGGTANKHYAAFLVSFGEGPADAIIKLWVNKALVYDATLDEPFFPPLHNFRFYPGDHEQEPDPLLVSLHTHSAIAGVTDAIDGNDVVPAYRGEVCVMILGLEIDQFGGGWRDIEALISYPSAAAARSTGADLMAYPSEGIFDSFQTHPVMVDWDRMFAYFVTDDSPAGSSGLRRIDLVSMEEDFQILEGDMGEDFLRTGNGWFACPDGGLVTQSGPPSNSRVMVRFDSVPYYLTHTFGRSQIPTGMSSAGFEACEVFSVISKITSSGRKDYLLCGGIGDSYGLLTLPDLEYRGDSDTLGWPTGKLQSVVGGKIGDGYAYGYVTLATKDGGYVTDLEVVQVKMGAYVTAAGVATFTADDIITGETKLSQCGEFLAYDEVDDTIIISAASENGATRILIKIDPSAGTITWKTGSLNHGPLSAPGEMNASRLRGETIGWVYGIKGSLVRTTDGEILNNGDITFLHDKHTLSRGSYNSDIMAYIATGEVVLDPSDKGVVLWFFNRQEETDTSVGAITTALAARNGVPAGDIDTTDIDSLVLRGMRIENQTTARTALEELFLPFGVDPAEIDFKTVFKQRGGVSARTITQEDMSSLGSDDGEPFDQSRVDESELPIRVALSYMDIDRGYQVNTQEARRMLSPLPPASRAEEEIDFSSSLALTAEQAKRSAEIILFSAHVERQGFEKHLGPEHIDLDPTDVVRLELDDGSAYRARLVDAGISHQLSTVFSSLREEAGLYSSIADAYAGASGTGLGMPTRLVVESLVLDVPLLIDADEPSPRESLQHYFLMGPYRDHEFLNGALYRTDGAMEWLTMGSVSHGMPWGVLVETLEEPPWNSPFMTDEVNTLTVFMESDGDKLFDTTQVEMVDGANRAAIITYEAIEGEDTLQAINVEILHFREVTSLGFAKYALTGLMRARRGTDGFVLRHGLKTVSWDLGSGPFSGESGQVAVFVLLDADAATIGRYELELTDLADTMFYKASPSNVPPRSNEVPVLELRTDGNALRPYEPGLIKAERLEWDHIRFTWHRRNRIGGNMLDVIQSGEFPLDEDNETFLLEIYKDGEPDILTRAVTIYAGTLEDDHYDYTRSAQEMDEFGAKTTEITFRLTQTSGQVGTGLGQKRTITILHGDVE